jgi:cell division septation protein DedD
MRRGLIALSVAGLIAGLCAPARALAPPGTACPVFPSNNVWHADISKLPVNKRSAAWLSSMSASSTHLHPDFGPSGGFPYGIPYNVVSGSHPKVHIAFTYADESDPGPYPFGSDISIEGGSNAGGDRHAIMIDKSTCVLYELYDAHYSSHPTAGSGAIWKLTSNKLRPAGWTSADAAGLPIFAGLVRLDEVRAGNVNHAIRVTASQTDRSYIWPARHQAGAASNHNLPPMGARFRLKAGYSIARFRSDTQTILRAMKKYGLIVADNGSNWYFQGTAEDGWSNAMLDELKSVPAGAFEAVDESSLMIDANSGQVRTATPVAPSPTPTPTRTKSGSKEPTATPSSSPRPTPSRSPSATPTAAPSPGRTVIALGPPARRQDSSWWTWLSSVVVLGALGVFAFARARNRSARRNDVQPPDA